MFINRYLMAFARNHVGRVGLTCGICRRDHSGNRRSIRGHRRRAACAGSGDRLEQ